jgi:hypothetical protein
VEEIKKYLTIVLRLQFGKRLLRTTRQWCDFVAKNLFFPFYLLHSKLNRLMNLSTRKENGVCLLQHVPTSQDNQGPVQGKNENFRLISTVCKYLRWASTSVLMSALSDIGRVPIWTLGSIPILDNSDILY